MFYSIRHITKFTYSGPVSESIMETRMHPRSEGNQHCLTFQLAVSPRARVFSYRDYLGNNVHYFDVPGYHNALAIVAEALVDVQPPESLPWSLRESAWSDLDNLLEFDDSWDALRPSEFARPSSELLELSRTLNVAERRDDPLSLLRELNTGLYHWFDYAPKTTRVDSPIEHALRERKGVCQDFAHIMITMVRQLGIPCRYVSGYLFHSDRANDRSSDGATHAWVEALLPNLGWVGFDPTNNLIAGPRHIRTAVGMDYADVPPTHGVFKGNVSSELSVKVRVEPSESLPPALDVIDASDDWVVVALPEPEPNMNPYATQQQQQQQ
jgi:transglutaminase-like putative cysteine protease